MDFSKTEAKFDRFFFPERSKFSRKFC